MTLTNIDDEQRDTRLFEDRTLQDRLKRRINLMLATDKERRLEVHVSDLLFPRKGYFGKTLYEPLTDPELGYFIAGRGHHAIIQALRATGEMSEVEVGWKGVKGTIDLLGDVVIEIKTTRVRKKYTVETVPDHWMEQLGMYVAMVHPTSKEGNGILFVLYLMSADFRCYRVTFENLPRIRKRIETKKMLLDAAVKGGNHASLPLCPEWMCSPAKCKFYRRCSPPEVVECEQCGERLRKGAVCPCLVRQEDPSHPALNIHALPASWRPSPKQ